MAHEALGFYEKTEVSMRSVRLIFALFLITCLSISCTGELFIPEEESEYVSIPKGWRIERAGAYSSLSWNPRFRIEPDGSAINFISKDGDRVEIGQNEELGLSANEMEIEFLPGFIKLTIDDLCLEFEKVY